MVNTSLFTGLSGLQAHSRYIDVIGNNLANVSTPGFWGSRTTFSDILSFTLSPGAAPTGNFGGNNPMQIGLGVGVGSIDLRTDQGTFEDTGRPLDVALQGKGFFTLSSGVQTYYSRVGTFGVDSARNLVDIRSGFRVLNSSGGNINVPVTDTLPPQATAAVDFQGNLPAEVAGPLAEIITSETPLLEGTAASKAATPPAATYNMSAYSGNGAQLMFFINGKSGIPVSFAGTAFTNAAAALPSEIAAAINASAIGNDVVATGNDATGALDFQTIRLGENASLRIDQGPAAASAGILGALNLNSTLASGTQTPVTAATNMANLTGRQAVYQSGDGIVITGTRPNGIPVSATFRYGAANDGTTVGDFITFMNVAFGSTDATNGSTASLASDASGNLVLTANERGDANLSLKLSDAAGNVGTSLFTSFEVTQDGSGPDSHLATIDIFDSLGRSHPVTLTFTRTETDSKIWDLTATMDATEGTITNGTVAGISFNADGSFQVIGGGTNFLEFNFAGVGGAPQRVTLNMGTSGQLDGLTLTGNKASAAATNQDGYAAGELLTVAFTASGQLVGSYSNGLTNVLDTLRISVFPNQGGLLRAGETMFVEAPNTDNPIATTAGVGGAGVLRPGSLENSNVDIATEFVKLIEAQRGFQANSRVITTTDEILAELINIVR